MNIKRVLVLVGTLLALVSLVMGTGLGQTTTATRGVFRFRLLLPIVLRDDYRPPPAPTPTSVPWICSEPANNNRGGACGPMMSNVVYLEYISSAGDSLDWFYFDMATWHTVEVWLTNIPQACDYDLYLRASNGDHITSSANNGNADEHIMWGPVPGGRYYLVVVPIQGWSSDVPYALRADFQ